MKKEYFLTVKQYFIINLCFLTFKNKDMNIKKIIKSIASAGLVFTLIFSLSSCCDNSSDNEDQVVDTIKVVQIIEKTRSELIVNRDTIKIADWNNMTDFENKHTPDITFGEQDEKGYVVINVSVGSSGIVHPSTDEHWIDFMTLFINDEEYKHIEINNGEGSNKQDFFAPLKNGDIVKVILGCNLHGIWENSVHFE